MGRPERGTPEYEQYKAEKRSRGYSGGDALVPGGPGGRSSSRRRSTSRHSRREDSGDEYASDASRVERHGRSSSRAPDESPPRDRDRDRERSRRQDRSSSRVRDDQRYDDAEARRYEEEKQREMARRYEEEKRREHAAREEAKREEAKRIELEKKVAELKAAQAALRREAAEEQEREQRGKYGRDDRDRRDYEKERGSRDDRRRYDDDDLAYSDDDGYDYDSLEDTPPETPSERTRGHSTAGTDKSDDRERGFFGFGGKPSKKDEVYNASPPPLDYKPPGYNSPVSSAPPLSNTKGFGAGVSVSASAAVGGSKHSYSYSAGGQASGSYGKTGEYSMPGAPYPPTPASATAAPGQSAYSLPPASGSAALGYSGTATTSSSYSRPIPQSSMPGSFDSEPETKPAKAPSSPNPFQFQTGGSVQIPPSPNMGSYRPQAVPQVGRHQKTASTSLGLPHLQTTSLSPGGMGGPQMPSQPMPSPALQPYHGTYQSISPLPSPIMGPSSSSPLFSTSAGGSYSAGGGFSLGPVAYPEAHVHSAEPDYRAPISDIPGVSYVTPSSQTQHHHSHSHSSGHVEYAGKQSPLLPSRNSTPSPEPHSSYDAIGDAKAILADLKTTFSRPSAKSLIEILPTLTPPQLRALRHEYKAQYRGVNLAKHVKSVFTTTTPFGKIVFAVALGPYESEAWFANSWYQKRETRNELLIESLMGRTNAEIACVKAAFKDAKYDASLEKAVSAELPSNKFRMAVLIQLSCVRMEEDAPIDLTGIRQDVARLGNILRSRTAGGETEMIDIIVNRSDRWLREVASTYRRVYDTNLLSAIMMRSKNLVGEVLLHILNGAIDKPLRDAKLLDQAITAVLEDKREDLLISRATRIHWDPKHLKHVKSAFRKKYRVDVAERLKAAARGSYLEFLLRMLREV